jgi:hypothetical protein
MDDASAVRRHAGQKQLSDFAAPRNEASTSGAIVGNLVHQHDSFASAAVLSAMPH